jgi:hypothetical protein
MQPLTFKLQQNGETAKMWDVYAGSKPPSLVNKIAVSEKITQGRDQKIRKPLQKELAK